MAVGVATVAAAVDGSHLQVLVDIGGLQPSCLGGDLLIIVACPLIWESGELTVPLLHAVPTSHCIFTIKVVRIPDVAIPHYASIR